MISGHTRPSVYCVDRMRVRGCVLGAVKRVVTNSVIPLSDGTSANCCNCFFYWHFRMHLSCLHWIMPGREVLQNSPLLTEEIAWAIAAKVAWCLNDRCLCLFFLCNFFSILTRYVFSMVFSECCLYDVLLYLCTPRLNTKNTKHKYQIKKNYKILRTQKTIHL